MNTDSGPETGVVVDADLFERARDDPAVRDELIEKYIHVAEYLSRRFSGRGESADDLRQVAMVGLIKSVDGFDPSKGFQFQTYATSTIVGELKRHFRDKGWAVRVPRRLQEVGAHVTKASAELAQELGRDPTLREIAERTGESVEEVLEAMDAAKAYATSPLDAPGDDERGSLMDTLGIEDPSFELLSSWVSVGPALEALAPRERQILYLRFVHDKTQSEIAEEMGISQMHVSRLLTKTLESLRDAASED